MEEDVQAKMRGDGFRLAFWREPDIRETIKLEMMHIMASLLILSGGLAFSSIIFFGEKLHHKCKMKAPTGQGKKARTIIMDMKQGDGSNRIVRYEQEGILSEEKEM